MQDRAVEQAKAEERARGELERYHCECVSVLISQIILPEELMEIQTRRVIAAQQQEMYVEQQKAEQKRIATDNTRAKADRQPDLVAAQIGVQIAEQTKQRTIIEAEGRARAVELEGEAEGKKILAVGSATAEAYEQAGRGGRPAQPRRHRGDEGDRGGRAQDHAGHHGRRRRRRRRQQHLLRLHRPAAVQRQAGAAAAARERDQRPDRVKPRVDSGAIIASTSGGVASCSA